MRSEVWELKVVWFAVIVVAVLAYGCGKGEEAEMPAGAPEGVTPEAETAAGTPEGLTPEASAAVEEAAEPLVAKGEMLIVPKVGVGDVKFGMTLDEVKKLWGEPDRIEGGVVYSYYLKGLHVHGSRPSGIVAFATCFAAKTVRPSPFSPVLGPRVRDFAGKTAEGIGIGSTVEEVVEAYGEPSSKGPGQMQYDGMLMTFTLEDGKVAVMLMRGDKEMLKKRVAEVQGE